MKKTATHNGVCGTLACAPATATVTLADSETLTANLTECDH